MRVRIMNWAPAVATFVVMTAGASAAAAQCGPGWA